MKHLKISAIFLLMGLLTLTFTNCSNGAKSDNQTEETIDRSGPEYTSAYVCPMHCKGSGSDEPGECPVCHMAYVENEDHAVHSGDEGHQDHDNHDDHSGHDH